MYRVGGSEHQSGGPAGGSPERASPWRAQGDDPRPSRRRWGYGVPADAGRVPSGTASPLTGSLDARPPQREGLTRTCGTTGEDLDRTCDAPTEEATPARLLGRRRRCRRHAGGRGGRRAPHRRGHGGRGVPAATDVLGGSARRPRGGHRRRRVVRRRHRLARRHPERYHRDRPVVRRCPPAERQTGLGHHGRRLGTGPRARRGRHLAGLLRGAHTGLQQPSGPLHRGRDLALAGGPLHPGRRGAARLSRYRDLAAGQRLRPARARAPLARRHRPVVVRRRQRQPVPALPHAGHALLDPDGPAAAVRPRPACWRTRSWWTTAASTTWS
jgi:hypothetical protein